MSGPRALRSILDQWQPGGAGADVDPQSLLAAAWPDAVGAHVARRTRPGKLREGVLTIYTAGSTWSHQLTFLAPTIVTELNARCPTARVQRLRFVVAAGRMRALLDGFARCASDRGARRHVHITAAIDALDESAEDIVGRLRRRQEALDRQRARDGWTRCSKCSGWREPASGERDLCRLCSDARRDDIDRSVERVLTDAPWLRAGEVASHLPDADGHSFERARRRLLTRWEEHLFAARGRLRRGALHPVDRMIAWSYVMMRSGNPQQRIGRAVVADALGEQWAQQLIGPAASSVRKATSTPIQKQHKTNARAFSARERTTRGPRGD